MIKESNGSQEAKTKADSSAPPKPKGSQRPMGYSLKARFLIMLEMLSLDFTGGYFNSTLFKKLEI